MTPKTTLDKKIDRAIQRWAEFWFYKCADSVAPKMICCDLPVSALHSLRENVIKPLMRGKK